MLISMIHEPHTNAYQKLGAYCTIAMPLPPQKMDEISDFRKTKLNPRNCVVPISDEYIVILNEHGFSVLAKDHYNGLTDNRIALEKEVIKNYEDIGILTSYPSSQGIQLPSVLSAWVSVTEQCNLGCSYCFKDHSNYALDKETGQYIAKQLVASAVHHNYASLDVTYAGGEPLMQFDTVASLHKVASTLASSSGIDYKAHIVTNGVLLTDNIITRLSEMGIRPLISLDGISDQSNIERRDHMQRSTTSKVKRNILACRDAGMDPLIAVTITEKSLAGLAETTSWLIDQEVHFSFGLQQHAPNSDQRIQGMKDYEVIASMSAAFAIIEDRLTEISMSLSSLLDHGHFLKPHQHACSAGKDHLVFDSKGDLYACPMEVEALPRQELDDAITVIREQSDVAFRLSVEEKEGCRDCQWKYWCAGGCPVNTRQATGRSDVRSPWCEVYKAIFPKILRLEGKRLLVRNDMTETN